MTFPRTISRPTEDVRNMLDIVCEHRLDLLTTLSEMGTTIVLPRKRAR